MESSKRRVLHPLTASLSATLRVFFGIYLLLVVYFSSNSETRSQSPSNAFCSSSLHTASSSLEVNSNFIGSLH